MQGGAFLFPSSLAPATPEPHVIAPSIHGRGSGSSTPMTPRGRGASTSSLSDWSPQSIAVAPSLTSKAASSLKDSLELLRRQHTETQACIKQEIRVLKNFLVAEFIQKTSDEEEIWRDIQRSVQQCMVKQDEAERLMKNWEPRHQVVKPDHDDVFMERASRDVDEAENSIPQERKDTAHQLTKVANARPVDDSETTKEVPGRQVLRASTREAMQKWWQFERDMSDVNQNALFQDAIESTENKKHCFYSVLAALNLEESFPHERPQNVLATSTEHPLFVAVTVILIFANTIIMGYETNEGMKRALTETPGEGPEWIHDVNSIFNYIFLAELVYRLIALRLWFFVGPEFGWNLFDMFVVVVSLAADAIANMNLTFVRTFRLLRAFRVVRVVRVLRIFRELRKMLFAIMACVSSLAWTFIFLLLVIFIFTIFLLQGLTLALQDMVEGDQADLRQVQQEVGEFYPDLGSSMLSLLAAVTGGADWMTVRAPLVYAGHVYTGAFLLYVIFVIVGIMNVLTGVFLSSASEFTDKDLIVQSEKVRVEQHVLFMLDLFKELDTTGKGTVNREQFLHGLQQEYMQAYLSAYDMEPTHLKLLFDFLRDKESDTISKTSFVTGMLGMHGDAKALDFQVIRHLIEALHSQLEPAIQCMLRDDSTLV